MLNCRQVSQLVSESLDRKLPLGTRIHLWMHLPMCGICAKFRRTMIRVDRELKDRIAQDQPPVNLSTKLPTETRQRLKHFVESHK